MVLPAPLGPITACSSPSGMAIARLSVATMPPKRLDRFSTRSRSAMANLSEQTIDAAAPEQHDQQQQRPEDDLPVLGDPREHLLEDQQRHRAEQWAEDGAHAAEHDHDDEIARA